jgi:hypothetical protein
MSNQKYKLPKEIDNYLATLSKTYKHEGLITKLEIIANAQVRMEVGRTYYARDGGTDGHALFLGVPESLYLDPAREFYEAEIASDLNTLNKVQNECIEDVFIELQRVEDRDWRSESGVLLDREIRAVSQKAAGRIWAPGYRLFLSHKVASKRETSSLKDSLKPFGISCFVAHEDIKPTKAWQAEIENALLTMDAFVALMTPDFHESDWTDQEVGFAVARDVPIIAVRLGRDPYGFIGKFQALQCDWAEAPIRIAQLLIKHPKAFEAFISALRLCSQFEDGNTLSKLLPSIERISQEQETELVSVFNTNYELRGSFGFNGRYPYKYGGGLPELLKRTRGADYALDDDKEFLIAVKR